MYLSEQKVKSLCERQCTNMGRELNTLKDIVRTES